MVVCGLEERAASLLLLLRVKDGLDSVVEHILQIGLGLGRALEVLDGLDLLRQLLSLGSRHDGLAARAQLLKGIGIITEIQLGSYQDIGDIGAEVHELGIPLQKTHREEKKFGSATLSPKIATERKGACVCVCVFDEPLPKRCRMRR